MQWHTLDLMSGKSSATSSSLGTPLYDMIMYHLTNAKETRNQICKSSVSN